MRCGPMAHARRQAGSGHACEQLVCCALLADISPHLQAGDSSFIYSGINGSSGSKAFFRGRSMPAEAGMCSAAARGGRSAGGCCGLIG